MKKDEMINRIKKVTPEWDAILNNNSLNNPKPKQERLMTENQLKELRDAINYDTTMPYKMLTDKDKACITMAVDMAWWGTQKMNGDWKMKESDKKLIAEGKAPGKDQIKAYFNDLFKPVT